MRSYRDATCVLLLFAAMSMSCRRDTDPWERLSGAVASSDQRPVTARIARLPYASARPRVRSATMTATPSAELLGIQSAAEQILSRKDRPDHASAVALLVSGRAAKAVTLLASLAANEPSNAMYWSDLAAARHELATERDSPELQIAALAAANAALRIDPAYAPALFNRALALDALGLTPYAVSALTRYRSIDSTSKWAGEAADRIQNANHVDRASEWSRRSAALERGVDVESIVRDFPQQARTSGESDYLARWAEAHLAGDTATAARWLNVSRAIGDAQLKLRGERLLSDAVAAIDNAADRTRLSKAYLTYRKGRLLYKTDSARVAEGLPFLTKSEREFASAQSPMALVAAYYRANALFDAHQRGTAEEVLDRLNRSVPPHYGALRAQLAWLRSTMAANAGQPYAALTAAVTSANQFRELGESEYAAKMEMAASRTLDRLGRTPEAYRLRRRAFESASAAGKASLWESLLNSSARAEVKAQHWDSAASFFALELESPPISPLLRFDALLWRAVAESRVQGLSAPALAEARAAAEHAPDAAMREDMQTELQFVEAASMTRTDPNRASALLTTVIETRLRNTRVSNLAVAYLERARAHANANRPREQEADLRNAIAFYERQAGEIQRDDLRDAFSGTTGDAYAELTELLVRTGRTLEAFEIAEQARACGLLAFESRRQRMIRSASPETLARSVSRDTVVVHYTTLADDLLIAVIETGRYRAFTVPAKRAEVEDHVRRLTHAVADENTAEQRASGRWLYDRLIAPVGTILAGGTLVIVPDDALDPIPFAALVSPSGRYLVEDMPIVIAPSARVFLTHAGETAEGVFHRQLALIADPAIDSTTFPSLGRLPGARRDVYRLAAGHEATVLSDGDATHDRVISALQTASDAHIAAHALVNEDDAWKSLIVLAPDGRSDGALYLHEIVNLDLDRLRLVTLAGCRTSARGPNSGSVSSLARAFLAAGSHNVIGTLWDVDDSFTSELTSEIDGALHEGHRPAEALRVAQLSFLRSADVKKRAARHWAGVQLYGCNR
jgi:CHAT domain-containing protein